VTAQDYGTATQRLPTTVEVHWYADMHSSSCFHSLAPLLGLGRLCSKTRPLCYAFMLPTTSHYALGWVLLCSISRLSRCLEL